jgi:hypothetical protein
MGANPFINIGDDLLAEVYNGGVTFLAAFNPLFTINLPDDLDGGVFVIGSVDDLGNLSYIKAAFMLTFLTLVNTQITNGTIQLAAGQTTGTATFRIYPNIEPLLNWESISWIAGTGGSLECTINRVSDSTIIQSNISNPQDLSAEDMGLEFIDFIFTLTQESGVNPVLESVSIQLQGGL